METRRWSLLCWLGVVTIGLVAGEPAGDETKRAPTKPPMRVVRAGDLSLEYAALPLPAGRRSARRERDVLLAWQGVLKSKGRVAYGRTVLPAGEYRVTMRGPDKKKLQVCVWPRSEPARKTSTRKASVRKTSTGKTRKKSDTKTSASRKTTRRTQGKTSTALEKSEGKSGVPGADAEPAPLLCIPMRLVTEKERVASLAVQLKSLARGQKLRLTLRVGLSAARCHVRTPDGTDPRATQEGTTSGKKEGGKTGGKTTRKSSKTR